MLLKRKGALPAEQIKALHKRSSIKCLRPLMNNQIQPASMDLRLSKKCWEVEASFLPGHKKTVRQKLSKLKKREIDIGDFKTLVKGKIYIIQIQEELSLPGNISAIANAKSSTGRLDILTRLISDNSSCFDRVIKGYKGPLYAEIAPNSFSVFAKENIKLNQIRFKLDHSQIINQNKLNKSSFKPKNFSINLKYNNNYIIGYRAKPHTDLIDLSKINYYKIEDYWEKIIPNNYQIVLDPGAFYILSSREFVSIAPNQAAEMAPYLPLIGEFRVHYAGFFDPGFGYSSDNTQKSRAVLEVRCHDTPFILEHGQNMGQLIFENMLEEPDLIYGKKLKSNYQGQGLKLSKHFKA